MYQLSYDTPVLPSGDMGYQIIILIMLEKKNTGERGSGTAEGVQMSGHLSVVSYMIMND